MITPMRWDLFCKVIDNHGDLGVCWRLAVGLAARGQQVRLWIDDPSGLAWMAPGGHPAVQVVRWDDQVPAAEPGDVVVEAFGCDPHEAFVEAIAQAARDRGHPCAWINLEYLSAEGYVERCHGLPSPIMSGPAKGLGKRFFYPGFTARTGGLLREAGLMAARERFDRAAWRRRHGLPTSGERLVSLFCYEPAALPELLAQWATDPITPTRLLVTEGRARAATHAAIARLDARQAGWNAAGRLVPLFLPLMPQTAFDELLWACDLNFVRGEDSLVRALWAGQPFVWHLYPQDDEAHHAKLHAFLDWMQAPASLRQAHAAWNGLGAPWPAPDLAAWGQAAQAARARLLAQDDLVTQLMAAAEAAHG